MLNILKAAGGNCERLLERRIRDVPVKDVEIDEAWTFCLKKERHRTPQEKTRDDIGDQYVFIAIESSSKLVLCWQLGRRETWNTRRFIRKLRRATTPDRFQLTSDAFSAYPDAIATALYDRADYAQLIKLYGRLPGSRGDYYRPAKIKGTVSAEIMGMPAPKRICTSHVERKNGSLRQWCKRMTRLTYAFSKSRENLRAALALHFAHYNFCRIHGSLRVTPAMEAGITDHAWAMEELLASA